MKRYNFFIEEGQLNSLEQMAKDKGVSASHEIREALQNRIDRHAAVRPITVSASAESVSATTVSEPDCDVDGNSIGDREGSVPAGA